MCAQGTFRHFATVLALTVLFSGVGVGAADIATGRSVPATVGLAQTDGCSAGSVSVDRQVRGYEFVPDEFSSQFEGGSLGPTFDTQLFYTRVRFTAVGGVDANCQWTVPTGVTRGHVLVVGGGGAGGSEHGGGGGGGGVFYGKVPITHTVSGVFTPGSQLTITVGAGGVPAANGCTGSGCNGGSGNPSMIYTGGSPLVTAGGGGGGGGDENPAPAVGLVTYDAGGGGGGGALAEGGGFLAGAQGAASLVENWAYNSVPGGLLGGAGGGGAAGAPSGIVRISGGGGGAKGQFAPGTGEGAGGVGITFDRRVAMYGAGGGGMERHPGNCNPEQCYSYYSKPSLSPTSGGTGGLVTGATQGVDGTGGGGGGGRTGAVVAGGQGGSGVVMILFPDPIEVTGGAVTVATVYGTAITTPQFSFTFGNPTLATTYRIRRAGFVGIDDLPPTGLSMANRQLVVSDAALAGAYDLVVTATNTLGTVGFLAVTLTVDRANQPAVAFTSSAPTAARVAVGGYTPTLSGGAGTGTYVVAVDETIPPNCTLNDGVVEFLRAGTCTVTGFRQDDANHQASALATQNFMIQTRDTQAPVSFVTTSPDEARVGDAGYLPVVAGGSGDGAYVVTSADVTVCTTGLDGAVWTVSHVSEGTCTLQLTREADDMFVASDTETMTYLVGQAQAANEPDTQVVAPPACGILVDGVHQVATPEQFAAVGSGGAGGGLCGLTARYQQKAHLLFAPVETPAVQNFSPLADNTDRFGGIYDGAGFLLDGIVLHDADASYVSIFGVLDTGAVVRGLRVGNVTVTGKDSVGVIAGLMAAGATIIDVDISGATVHGSGNDVGGLTGRSGSGGSLLSDVAFSGAVTSSGRHTGGIVGYAGNATLILRATATATVTSASDNTGGIAGYALQAQIDDVRVDSTVTGVETVGGLVGYANTTIISNAIVTVTVTGTGEDFGSSTVGGVVGYATTAVIQNVTLSGVITASHSQAGGLVGYATTAVVANAQVNATVTGESIVGGVIGYANTADVRGITFSGDVIGTGQYVGGIVGYNNDRSAITTVVATGTVIGRQHVGGVAGYAHGALSGVSSQATVTAVDGDAGGISGELEGVLIGSYARGAVSTDTGNVAGLVGLNSGVIMSSFARGTVTGNATSTAGGLVGAQTQSGTINLSYATGMVNGGGGGLIGSLDDGHGVDPVASFWDIDTSGKIDSAGGIGVATQLMRDVDTYLAANWPIVAGWEPIHQNTDWGICAPVNDGYPYFLREYEIDPCIVSAVALPVVAEKSVTCDFGGMDVLAVVTCIVAGGMPGQQVGWQASFNPTFASGTATLGVTGAASFMFVIPADAAGFLLSVQVDGWPSVQSVDTAVGVSNDDAEVTDSGAKDDSDGSVAPVPKLIAAGGGSGQNPGGRIWLLLAGVALAVACLRRFSIAHAVE